MEVELREANLLLTVKLNKLIQLLNVCPLCVEGHLREHKKPLSTSMMGRAFASGTNTWDLTIEMYCSNQSCDYETAVDNPDYKEPIVLSQASVNPKASLDDTANDQFADLFG